MATEFFSTRALLSTFATSLVLVGVYKVLLTFWWTPLRIRRAFNAQGIKGPPYKILFGNAHDLAVLFKQAQSVPMTHISHNILPRVLPHHDKWKQEYGDPFVYLLGHRYRLIISEPELCKEVLSNKFGHYPKPKPVAGVRDVLANGLVNLDGEKWVEHRRIVSPAFFIEKLKAMTPKIASLVAGMLEKWHLQLQAEGLCKEMDVSEEFRILTADIIAHTAFGSSYAEGKQVFDLQQRQLTFFGRFRRSIYIPGSRYIPTTTNRCRWKINKQIRMTLQQIIDSRLDSPKEDRIDLYGNDLLGLMMAAYKQELQGNQKNLKMSMEEIIDECQTFYFAGHETTSALLTWTVMLLAIHSEWQERAREEVLSCCGTNHPDAEALNHLKIVGMVLNESLRLYPPAVGVFREAKNDMKLGHIVIPGGTTLFMPFLDMHLNPEFWGEDAHDFNPERFTDGISKACKHPMAFLPFSAGPRNCVGQNFSLIEAKIVLTMILQHFRFRLSPGYKHAPYIVLTLQPQHGMQVIFEKR